MLSPNEAAWWQTTYNVSYYVLLGALFISFVSTGLTFVANNRLTDDLTARLTDTTAATGRATAEAGRANERAATLENTAAEANCQTAQLRLDLERERLERVKLQASLSSRHLTPEQSEMLGQALLKSDSLPREIEIETITDREAEIYAAEINAVISKRTPTVQSTALTTLLPDGITIYGANISSLMKAFEDASIPVQRGPALNGDDVKIVVGAKPPS